MKIRLKSNTIFKGEAKLNVNDSREVPVETSTSVDGVEVHKQNSTVKVPITVEYAGPVEVLVSAGTELEIDAEEVKPPAPQPPSASGTWTGREFADTSIWRRPLGERKLAANTKELVAEFKAYHKERGVWVGLGGAYSAQKYVVDKTVPIRKIHVADIKAVDKDLPTERLEVVKLQTWTRLYERLQKGFRIPNGFQPAGGRDAHAYVVDVETGEALEGWRFLWKDGELYMGWGAVLPNVSNHSGSIPKVKNASGGWERQGARASGVTLWGGIITLDQLEKDADNMALEIALPYPLNTFVPPAVDSDGHSQVHSKWVTWASNMPDYDAVAGVWRPKTPEGTLYRLPSSFTVKPEWCPLVRHVCHRLMKHGAYVGDKNMDRPAFTCEITKNGAGDYAKFLNGKKLWEIYGEWADMAAAIQVVESWSV